MKKRYSYRGLIAGFIFGVSLTAGVMAAININNKRREKAEKNTGGNTSAAQNPEPIQVIISEQNSEKINSKPTVQNPVSKNPENLKCFPKLYSKGGKIQLRENPSENSRITEELDNFECVTKIMDSGDWRYIRTENNNLSGYVHKENVLNEAKDYIKTHKVASGDGFANVREDAGKWSRPLKALPSGTEVVVFPEYQKNNWMYVGYMDENKYEYGYIHKSILKEIE